MLNQLYPDGSVFFFACPITVKSGDPVLIGTLAGVAIDDYNSTLGGTTFCLEGIYALTVVGHSSQSPVANEAIKPGDRLFVNGSYDAATNCTTGLTIDVTRGHIPFGNYMGSGIAAGVTDTAAPVRLKDAGYGGDPF